MAERGEAFAGFLAKAIDAFDRVDAGGDPARHRRRVAGAGADLEHPVAGPDPGCLEHQRDDVGLRDGLAGADRQRRILVGVAAQVGRNEHLARHLAQRGEDGRVMDTPAGDLLVDHAVAKVRKLLVQHPSLS